MLLRANEARVLTAGNSNSREERKRHCRIHLQGVMDVSGDNLIPFVKYAVRVGSEVHTDGWSCYSGLARAGYKHQITVISRCTELAHKVLPRVQMAHRFSSDC